MLKSRIRQLLKGAGANEVLTYSFVHADLLKKVGQSPDDSYHIRNALSPSLQYYRQSLTPSLLSHVHANIKVGYPKFALFELGKSHLKGQLDGGVPVAFDRLALVFAADKKPAATLSGAAYYFAKEYLFFLLDRLGVTGDELVFTAQDESDDDVSARYYQAGRSAVIHYKGERLGRVGEFSQPVIKNLKLPAFSSGFEIGLGPLLAHKEGSSYSPISKFPGLDQDICLRTDDDVTYAVLHDELRRQLSEHAPKGSTLSLQPIDVYKQEGASTKQTTFRITMVSDARTHTYKEMNNLMEIIEKELNSKIGAMRV